ncbi:MAG: putative toxin-antitoxin system toxin component, PIN family [Flavobacteriales bacterium]
MLIGKRVRAMLDIFKDQRFEVVVHDELLGEFEDVARRTKFRKYFPEQVVDGIVHRLREDGTMIPDRLHIEAISRDRDDDYLLALAKTAKAHVLLTGDRDLLVLETHGRTKIMNAKAFVKEYLG